MVEVAIPDSNPARKSAINPYVKRSFGTFLRVENFEKNVKSYIKTTSKMTFFKFGIENW